MLQMQSIEPKYSFVEYVLRQLKTTADVIDAVKNNHAISGPMTVGGGSIPASTYRMVGQLLKIFDEEEATFIVMMNGIRPDMMQDQKLDCIINKGYEPTDAAIGVFESAKMSTTPYPMLPYMGILHGALGNEIADFLQGKESASQALTDVEAAYMTAAKEKGFIN